MAVRGSVVDPDRRTAGYAAVDALVGLTILAVTVSLALGALTSARRLASAAVESGQAAGLLQYLMEFGPKEVGSTSGRSPLFAWRLDVALAPADPHAPAAQLCSRSAEAKSLKSRRRFTLATLQFCRLPEPSR